jgi:nicotinamide-nucleotide amidase
MAQSLQQQAQLIVELAKQRRLGMATVESCTAGALVHLLSQTDGASDVLHGGFVVYTKQNKISAVGVPEALLTRHTAVSAEVAQAMARGGLARSPADLVVSITGVAGPEPDEDGNPVGLVFVATASRAGRLKVIRLELGKLPKEEICAAAMSAAMTLLEESLIAHVP